MTTPARRIETKNRLSKRFGWRCWYCGARISPGDCHIDHIIPRSSKLEFVEHERNFALTCEYCNRAKFDLPLEQFMGWLDWLRSGNLFTPFDMSQEEVTDAIYREKGGYKEMPKLPKEI